MTAAEPRRHLAYAGPRFRDEHLRVARARFDPERGGGGARSVDRRADLAGLELAGPGVHERDTERGRLGGQAVGHRQRMEPPADGEPVDRHLAALDVLLDEQRRAPRGVEGHLDGRRDTLYLRHERQPALALPIRSFHHARIPQFLRRGSCLVGSRADDVPRLRNTGGREGFPLTKLRRRERAGLGRDGMRDAEPLGDTRRDRDGPVDSRRDDPVDALGDGEPLDPRLVLRGDDRAAVRIAEARGSRIAIERDHVEPVPSCSREQPELGRPRP